MLYLLPLERPAPDTPGDHHTQISGKSSGAQPDSPSAARNISAQSGDRCSGMGHRSQSPSCCRRAAVPDFDSRGSEIVAGLGAKQSLRAAPVVTSKALLALIRGDQLFISPLLPPSCRFVPTCSAYAYEAVEKWGVFRGVWYTLRRLLRCQPFGGQGYDPVP